MQRSPPVAVGSSASFIADVTLSEGTNTIYAKAIDAVGNVSPTSEPVTVKLDTTPPDISLNCPQVIYTRDEATISCAAPEAKTVIISVKDADGKVLQTADASELTIDSTKLLSPGAYSYLIKAFDLAGNAADKTGTIIVDKTPPEAYIEAIPQIRVISGTLALSGIDRK